MMSMFRKLSCRRWTNKDQGRSSLLIGWWLGSGKSIDSLAKKVLRKGLPISVESIEHNIFDVADELVRLSEEAAQLDDRMQMLRDRLDALQG